MATESIQGQPIKFRLCSKFGGTSSSRQTSLTQLGSRISSVTKGVEMLANHNIPFRSQTQPEPTNPCDQNQPNLCSEKHSPAPRPPRPRSPPTLRQWERRAGRALSHSPYRTKTRKSKRYSNGVIWIETFNDRGRDHDEDARQRTTSGSGIWVRVRQPWLSTSSSLYSLIVVKGVDVLGVVCVNNANTARGKTQTVMKGSCCWHQQKYLA